MKANTKQPAQILPANEEHLSAINGLAGIIWRECYTAIITREQIDYMLTRMYSLETLRAELQSGIRYERLLLEEELCGFASFGATEEPDIFKLHKLYLLPELHGRGLGSVLLNHCEHEVRKAGAKQLTLNVNKRNAKAIAAYLRNGFRVTDSVVVDIGHGFVMDDYVMTKPLI